MKINFNGKKALVRVDFNVPLDKQFNITDDTRIQAAMPTLKQILSDGGAIILMSHFGRPDEKLLPDGTIDYAKFTLRHIVKHLSSVLGRDVQFCEETVGEKATAMAADLKAGEVLLLENTRFYKEEKKGNVEFAEKLSKFGDVYVNDAFGSAHRAHASTTTVAQFFSKENKCFGYLMEAEVANGQKILDNPARPLTAILGGAKVSDKIMLIEKLLDLADNIIIGGGMTYTFVKANGGNIGNSLCEPDRMEKTKEIVALAAQKGKNIYMPTDNLCADDFSNTANTLVSKAGEIPDGWEGLDIGPDTIVAFAEIVKHSKTVLWNGPMGVFEFPTFAKGTNAIAEAVVAATENGAFSLIGGGDSASAINNAGYGDRVSFVSTGGGAMLEFLEGKELPGVAAILR
jgi:phosphoglycerate kinase